MHGSEDQKWSASLQRTLNKGVGGASLTIFAADCRCYKDVYVNSFFLCTARIWNSLPIEFFSLTYNLNSFKSRINKHLLTVGSLQRDLLYPLIFLYFFFLQLHARNSPLAVHPCMEGIPIQKKKNSTCLYFSHVKKLQISSGCRLWKSKKFQLLYK